MNGVEFLAERLSEVPLNYEPRLAAAHGFVSFTGDERRIGDRRRVVPAGSILQRADGQQYRTDADITVRAAGHGPITAVTAGSLGNAPTGTSLTLQDAIAGVSSCATSSDITGGNDLEGICACCNKPAPLFAATEDICRGCALLRQTYPAVPTGKLRLGLGNYLLVTADKITYWGKLKLPASIERRQASGALRQIVRELILDPPKPPWLFVAFARSNSPERLRVNTGNDLIYFSGKFFMPGTMDEPPVDRLHRKTVMALHQAAPKLTRAEWEQCARAYGSLSTSPEALDYLHGVYQRFPGLARYRVPPVRTPEYNALRVLAEEK